MLVMEAASPNDRAKNRKDIVINIVPLIAKRSLKEILGLGKKTMNGRDATTARIPAKKSGGKSLMPNFMRT